MRGDDVALIAFLASGIAIVGSLAGRKRKVEERRLKIVEEALRRPELDEATRRNLLEAVATRGRGGKRLAMLTTTRFWLTASFAVGWFLFVVCGGGFLLSTIDVLPLPRSGLAMGALTGLALLTLPRALVELRQRGEWLAGQR